MKDTKKCKHDYYLTLSNVSMGHNTVVENVKTFRCKKCLHEIVLPEDLAVAYRRERGLKSYNNLGV